MNTGIVQLRTAKIVGVFYVIYIIVLTVAAVLLFSETPPSSIPSYTSFILILFMPMELFLVLFFYWMYSKKETLENIMIPAFLMYTTGAVPVLYVFIIASLDSTMVQLAALLGMGFSLAGIGLSWLLILQLWDQKQLQSEMKYDEYL